MSFLKQQALFLFVSILTVVGFFFYQNPIDSFFKLPQAYVHTRLIALLFSVLINYALISLIYLLLRKTFITLLFSQIVFGLLLFINIKKEQYLSTSLSPSDFLLVKETFISAPWLLKFSVLLGLLICIGLCIFFYKKEHFEKTHLIFSNAFLVLVILGFFTTANFTNNFNNYCQTHTSTLLCRYTAALPNTRSNWIGDHLNIKQMGFMPFFFSKSVDSLNNKILKTEQIPEARITQILNQPTEQSQAPTVLPNVVFVMSESHWDPRILDSTIPKNLTPNIDKQQVSKFLSPSFGGGTANVEFEVLTSLNVFLNQNELAYVSKLKRPTYSLANYFNELGYDSTAMHNNGKFFYNRSSVYQNLGFHRFTSLENMVSTQERAKYINQAGWATDDLLYKNIELQLQQNDKPQFIYAISVENHPMYNDDRFGKNNIAITKTGISDATKQQLNTYLSGVQRADQKFQQLIEQTKQLKRPTIIVFFGDHLPNLQNVYDEYGFFASKEEKAEKNNVKFFTTPLAIWSNYPLNKQVFKQPEIAAHFLAPTVLEAAHLPLSPYYQFIKTVNHCYHTIHKVSVDYNPKCSAPHPQILNQYKDLNMDILNGKNFSYTQLHSY